MSEDNDEKGTSKGDAAEAVVSNMSCSVDSKEQLRSLPKQYLSGDEVRPLLQSDKDGCEYYYALRPLWYSVFFILSIELLERFAYYGIVSTQTMYLTGGYTNPDWNPGLPSSKASSIVSSSSAVAYTAPFVGGMVADGILGDYWNIIFGVIFLYLPGLILIALCAYPYALGPTFNMTALKAGMLGLWPIGAGFIKPVVNVFGAKQYHPLLQTKMISQYYVNFYMSINIGSLLGIPVMSVVAEHNTAAAYTIPAVSLGVGIMFFIAGSKRYVRAKPEKKALMTTLRILASPVYCKSVSSNKKSKGGEIDDDFVTGVYHLLAVFPAAALTIPFMIVYFQVSTVFVVQGEAMRVVGPFNASMMNIFDPISVCICGTLTSTFLFPFLDKKGLHFKYSHRFALGTAISALAVLMAIIIDRRIHDQLNQGKFHSMNIFWQVIVYFLVGAGEIFATAVGYDVAFKIAPKEQKGLASGINLFVIGAIPNFISVGLYKRCSSWFPIDPNIAEDYASSQLSKYLWVLFGIAIFGVVFNLLPQVSNLLESTINRSIEINAKEGSKKIAEEDGDLEDVRIRESSDCVETPGIEA